MPEGAQQASSDKSAIRPFHIGLPEEELTELRSRVNATRWPERETVTDDSQGVRLDHRTAEDHRAAHQSHGARPQRGGRVPPGHPLAAGPRVLRQADGHRVGSRPHRACLGRADEAPGIHPVRRAGRRLGRGGHPDYANRRRRNCSASTPTCLAPLRPTPAKRTDPRRPPGQHHAVLADEHRVSSARLYWENKADFFNAKNISIPYAISAFPDELYEGPRSWAERAYPGNMRAAFKTLR